MSFTFVKIFITPLLSRAAELLRDADALDRTLTRHVQRLEWDPSVALRQWWLNVLLAVAGLACGYIGVPLALLAAAARAQAGHASLRVVAVTALCSACTVYAVLVLKRAIGRLRPLRGSLPEHRWALARLESNCSMPSGDAAQAVLLCGMLARCGHPWAWLFVPAVCFARVYFGAHWVGDTIAGVVVGRVSYAAAAWLCD
jgi:membrane-associated phospholipid phosphatase